MGFFKKLKRSVKKRTKKITKGATKAYKTASGYKYVKKFYDKNKKGVKSWGKLAARAGAAYFTAGASEGLLAATGQSGMGLESIVGKGGAETIEAFKDGYDDAPYVLQRPSPTTGILPPSKNKVSRRVSSNLKKKPTLSPRVASISNNHNLSFMNNKNLLIAGGLGLVGLFSILALRGRK